MAEKTLSALIGDLRKKYQTVLAKAEALRLERDETANAPLSRDELVEQIDAFVDGTAARYGDAIRERIHSAATKPADFQIGAERPLSRTGAATGYAVLDHDAVSAGALIAMVGAETVKAALVSQVDALELQHGLPSAEREKRLSSLDQQIAKAEAEIASQRKSAASQGIFLEV